MSLADAECRPLGGKNIDVNGGPVRDPGAAVTARLAPADRVLVTGASGFVGSAAARAVLRANVEGTR